MVRNYRLKYKIHNLDDLQSASDPQSLMAPFDTNIHLPCQYPLVDQTSMTHLKNAKYPVLK